MYPRLIECYVILFLTDESGNDGQSRVYQWKNKKTRTSQRFDAGYRGKMKSWQNRRWSTTELPVSRWQENHFSGRGQTREPKASRWHPTRLLDNKSPHESDGNTALVCT